MPQGEGSHASRGGTPGVGAGSRTATGGTSQLAPVGGGARGLEAGLGPVRGGDWPLEEELEEAEGGASGLEAEEEGTQALGAGLQPREAGASQRKGEGWELLAGPGALAVVQAASCQEGAGSPGPSAFAPWSLPLPLQTCWAPPTCQGSCQHLPREGAWLKAPFRDPPTRPWCLTPEYRDLPGGAQALGKPSEAWNWVHVRFLTL